MRQGLSRLCLLVAAFIGCLAPPSLAADLRLLFLGDNGHHRPAERFEELAPALANRGVRLTYTDRMSDLNPETLADYDGLVLYANIDRIEDTQADAVLQFVAGGKGFIPLHCATYCWRNNAEMVALMGAQFQRHGGQVFSTQVAKPDHPIMRGYGSFTSWDETYIHHLHNEQNRTVLEYRVSGEQADGRAREPWTWVRTHGKGRVFYTAWGHDQRTFTNPGFRNLVERGIRWACGDDPGKVPAFSDPDTFAVPEMTAPRTDVAPFEYVDVGPKIPNYTPGRQWGAQGQPLNMMQKPLPPEESLKHFVTPKGMSVRLYADERSFQAKPIAMAWDERGRLWVCETVDYPNELGGDRDRIRICEDTDGDHVADKFVVFAEGLSIPTGIVIYRGGAIVQNGRETIYLKDTNGDDVSDQQTTLITGWAMGDTHGGVSNFRYGLDNWIWAMQGYNNSSPRIDGQRTQTFRQGFWRFRLSKTDPPKVTDLEFVRSTDNNTWGFGQSEEGLIFGSTANHNPSVFMPIPNRYYEQVRGWAPRTLRTIADSWKFDPITSKVRQVDQFGGYTAGAGHALYTARAFPEQWWNRTAFVCGPTGHLVGTFVLRADGANFASSSPLNLLASDDEWSAPIMAEVGPDGAVWVIDWYNYIVQHNPTPQGFETGRGNAYESDLRDKKHGRIYRIVPDDTTALHAFENLADAPEGTLVATLNHPSMRWRLHAQRLLIERRAIHSVDELTSLVNNDQVDAIGLNVGAIHALHTLDGLGVTSTPPVLAAVRRALAHASAGVRRNALAVLPTTDAGAMAIQQNQSLLTDDNAQVRLQAFLRLADMPPAAFAGQAVVTAAAGETDSLLRDALTSAAAAHSASYLKALTTQRGDAGANLQIARRVAEHVARGRPTARELGPILASLGNMSPRLQSAILDGLTAGMPASFAFEPDKQFDAIMVAAFEKIDSQAKGKLVRLAAQCRTKALDPYAEEIVAALVKLVEDTEAEAGKRIEAARELIGFRPNDASAVQAIIEQFGPQTTPEFGGQLLRAIQLSRAEQTGDLIVQAVPALTPKLRSAGLSTLLSRPDWVQSLLTALESRDIELTDLSLDQKQALRAFPNREIRSKAEAVLAMSNSLPDADRDKVLQSLMSITTKSGNVDAGREMFKKHCANCHQHGELGKNIGPNLTGMAVHPKAELLTHIIDPSRSVEGNFRIYTVVTNGGRVLNGMLAAETRTSITLIDTEARETSIQREDIDELTASRKSLMPEGFEKQMNEAQLTDLLEFLANKGRYVPVPLDRYATAISTKGLFHTGDNGPDRMIFPDWKPKVFRDIPFLLTDPNGKSRPNIILLYGPNGSLPPKMPRSVTLPCNTSARAIHLLSGVGGWNYPYDRRETVSMIVRLHYEGGQTEDHQLINGVHFADYIRRVDVPESELAFMLGGQQIRYLAVRPQRPDVIETVELIKGPDNSSPIVMAVTIERLAEGAAATKKTAAIDQQTDRPQPVVFTTQQDHRNMLEQLGITKLRPGRNANADAGNPANYDEAKANPYPELPAILKTDDGKPVTTPEEWFQIRRPELVEKLETELYGKIPENVPAVRWEVKQTREVSAGETAAVQHELVGVVDNSACPDIEVRISMSLTLPKNATGPVPVLLSFGWTPFDLERFNFRRPRRGNGPRPPSKRDLLIAAGWGCAMLNPSSVQADAGGWQRRRFGPPQPDATPTGAGLTRGIIGLTNHGQPRKPHQWGALRAWAWGASRALDHFENDDRIDAKRVGIAGVSRYGKAALVTMAFDQRFAMGLIASSGAGGTALYRRNFGESPENLASSGAYHWMAGNYLKYSAEESAFGRRTADDLSVDAHMMLALCAPRLTFISHGIPEKGDAHWLDHQGSFMAAIAAQPVFRLLGAKDLGRSDDYLQERMPAVNVDLTDGALAWRQHDGGHTDGPNVSHFIRWAGTHWKAQQEAEPEDDSPKVTKTRSLKAAVGDRFRIGAGVSHRVLQNPADVALIKQHFEILTPENCMKPQSIHPAEDRWNFGPSDQFAEFARANNIQIVGHCLVWAKDDRTAKWMMEEDGRPVSREVLLQRITDHVDTVVRRYRDVTTMWDVVNEALGDSGDELLRDSVYSRTSGIDFIVTAFKAARAADPDALLIYNDYNGHKPAKRKKLIRLLTELRNAGAPVDAYGMQGHFELGDNAVSDLRETFDALRDLGLKVVVSELDIDVVKRGRWWADSGRYRDELSRYDPYREGLPPDIEATQIQQYVALFQLFHEYRDIIERVSFWNLHDGQSWLNYFPWRRVNHPLLFDRQRRPKRAFHAVWETLASESPGSVPTRQHAALERHDGNSRLAHEQLLTKAKAGRIDVYFQGDSITRRWGATDYPELLALWKRHFHGWNAANFAWGGDTTHHILWRMRHGELDGLSPKVVVLQAGTNNLPWRGPASAETEADVVAGIEAIIAEFQRRTPGATIVLTALFPRTQNPELWPSIQRINKQLKQLADRKQTRYLNINDRLADPSGRLNPGMSRDGLHLEEPAYEIWAQSLKPIFAEVLGPAADEDHAPPPTGNPAASDRDSPQR